MPCTHLNDRTEAKHCYEDCPYIQYTPSVVLRRQKSVSLEKHDKVDSGNKIQLEDVKG